MKVELTEKEVKYIGEQRYLMPRWKGIFAWMIMSFIILLGTGHTLPDKTDSNQAYYIIAMGLLLHVPIIIVLRRVVKAGKDFLKEIKRSET